MGKEMRIAAKQKQKAAAAREARSAAKATKKRMFH
jgi:hypothetical protein